MKSNGRLRVGGGILVALFLCASLLAEAPPKMLLGAQTGPWKFSIVSVGSDVPLTHDYSQCGVSSAAKVILAPNGAAVLRSPLVCGGPFPLLPSTGRDETVLTFDDGTNSASFTVPPIGAIYDDEPAILKRPLIHDDAEGAWITVAPEYDDTPLFVVLWSATSNAAEPIIERFRASKPVAQYEIKARGVFWAEVFLGTDPSYRCFPSKTCAIYGSVYGFGSSGTLRGGSVRVSPFGEE